jgi:hypothetical protein
VAVAAINNNVRKPKVTKWVEYTHRQELEALPFKQQQRLGDTEKLTPLVAPKGFEYLWQHFAQMRQLCGSEAVLSDIIDYADIFMPFATKTDLYMLGLMNMTARIYAQQLDKDEAEWPED